METIRVGNVGAAVEDIQDRLSSIGYQVDETERSEGSYGRSTATAVARFRLDHGLSLGEEVDAATWAALSMTARIFKLLALMCPDCEDIAFAPIFFAEASTFLPMLSDCLFASSRRARRFARAAARICSSLLM